jgi:hypothetical protein
LSIFELQGWLPGLKGEGDAEQLPTIAIVANYDTFGAAPVCHPKNVLRIFFDILLYIFYNTYFLRRFPWEATAMEVEQWLSWKFHEFFHASIQILRPEASLIFSLA